MNRNPIVVVGLALLLLAGCKTLKVEHAGMHSEADWLTEGDSVERRNATSDILDPPLEEVWMYNAGAGFGPGSPLILGKAVLVGTRKGEVHAIDFETGKREGMEGFGDVVEGTPTIKDGMLYVPVSWGRRSLFAYDLSRGMSQWKLKGAPVTTGLLPLDDAFVAADADAWVRKYDARLGVVIWEQNLGDHVTIHTTPVLAADQVVVADDTGRVFAFDPADGEILWSKALDVPVYASMAADDEALYVSTTRGQFFALDVQSGNIRWTFALPDTTVHFSPPAVDGSLVVVGASDGYLRAFDAATGDVRWTFQNDAALVATPLLTPHTVYVGTMGEMLFALDRTTGSRIWKQQLKGRVKSAMAVRDGYLVVLSEPRFVYLFKSSSASGDVVSP